MPSETEEFKEGFFKANKEAGKSIMEAHDAWDNYLATTVTKEIILGTVGNLVTDFMYYDRKEDDELPSGAIEKAIAAGVITTTEIAEKFRSELESSSE